MQIRIGDKVIQVKRGDITEEEVDAIVNAANENLQHGGGVAGAIVRKGGSSIQEESKLVAPVPTGGAAITGAGNLPADYVIHAVGPVWGSGDEEHKLWSAFENSIGIAEEKNLKTIAFPAISAGIFGFPRELCADILLEAAKKHFTVNPDCSLERITFCLYDGSMFDIFAEKLRSL